MVDRKYMQGFKGFLKMCTDGRNRQDFSEVGLNSRCQDNED